jgi:hypothetical protein
VIDKVPNSKPDARAAQRSGQIGFRATPEEDAVSGVIASLVAVLGTYLAGYSVRPRGPLAWAIFLVIFSSGWVFIAWAEIRLLRPNLYSRLGSPARIVVSVPIRCVFLIAAAYLAKFVVNTLGMT